MRSMVVVSSSFLFLFCPEFSKWHVSLIFSSGETDWLWMGYVLLVL
jgi:hypothetical protein